MKRIFVLLLPLLGFIGCESTFQQNESPVLASVGNQSLTVNQAFDEIPSSVLEQDTLQAINTFVDQWIESKIAVDHALREGLANQPDVREKLDRVRNQILENALKEYVLSMNLEEIEVTREEAQNYYQENKDQFLLEERYVRFRYITTRTRTEADNANRDLMRGVEWAEILNNYSVDPERQLRESDQFWPISMAVEHVPMINRYLNLIGLSERSPIHFYRGQYHLVQLMEERPEGDNPELEWLIPQIEEWLKLEKARRITNNYLRNLYLEADANNEIKKANVSEIESLLSSTAVN